MALTDAQKEANSVIRKARDSAFRARLKELYAIEDAEVATIRAKEDPIMEAAFAEENRIKAERDVAIAALDAQIADLQRLRTQTEEQFRARERAARKPGSDAADRRNDAERELRDRLDREFPDLAGTGRWSAAAWEAKRKRLGMERSW